MLVRYPKIALQVFCRQQKIRPLKFDTVTDPDRAGYHITTVTMGEGQSALSVTGSSRKSLASSQHSAAVDMLGCIATEAEMAPLIAKFGLKTNNPNRPSAKLQQFCYETARCSVQYSYEQSPNGQWFCRCRLQLEGQPFTGEAQANSQTEARQAAAAQLLTQLQSQLVSA